MNSNYAIIRVLGTEVQYFGQDGHFGTLGAGTMQFASKDKATEFGRKAIDCGRYRESDWSTLALWAVTR